MGQLDGRVAVLQFPKSGGGDGEAPVLIRVKGLALRWRCVCLSSLRYESQLLHRAFLC